MATQPLRSARQWGSSHLSVVTQRVNGFTPPQQLLGRSQITGRLIEPDEESTPGPGTHAVHSVRQARQAEARALLDETLGLSLAARSTRSVTLCLAALARWAPVAGDPEQAALVAGRPRACAGGPGCGCGRCCGRERPTWWPRSGRRSAPTISTRYSPPAPGSPSGTRWQLPGPARRQYLADGITGNTPVVRRLTPMSAPAGPAVSADRKRRLAA